MTAPVASAPSARAPRSPGTDGDSNGGPPFASALDGALKAGRDHDVAAATRRSPQSEQRPDRGEHRAVGHDRADGPPLRQTPGNRANGPADRAARRTDDRERDGTPSTPADQPSAPGDPAAAADAGVVAAMNAAIPPGWVLPTPPALPSTPPTDGTAPTGPTAVVAGTPAPSTVVGDASAPPVTAGLAGPQPGAPGGDAAPAVPPADPTPAAAAQAPVTPGDVAVPVLAGPVVRGNAPGAAAVMVPPAAGPRPSVPSAGLPSTLPVGPADGDSPTAPAAVSTAPLLPIGPTPAWVRSASATDTAPGATAPPAAVGGTADSGAALPDLGSVPVAAGPASGDSASSDPGDTSRQDPGVAAADQSAGVVAPAPFTPATAVAPVAATTDTAPPAPVATQVAAQVVTLSQGPDATHSVTLVLHPDNLGPVHVQMTLDQGTVDLTLRGAHEHGRAALLDALPDLRRDLEAAGLSCSKLDVDRDTGGSWSSRQQSAQQQAAQQQWADQGRRQPDWSDGRVRPWSRTADSGDSRQVPAPTRSTSRGVDFRV